MSYIKTKSIVKVFLADGSTRCLILSNSHTPGALKFMICRKSRIKPENFYKYDVVVLTNNNRVSSLKENPAPLYNSWKGKANEKYKLLFVKKEDLEKGFHFPSTTPSACDEVVRHDSSYKEKLKKLKSEREQTSEKNIQLLLEWTRRQIGRDDVILNEPKDLKNGIVFFLLIERLSKTKLKGWHKNCENVIFKLDNLNMVLNLLAYFGIFISDVTPVDILENDDLCVALLHVIYEKYQAQGGMFPYDDKDEEHLEEENR